jgi:hypothetical protein
MTFRCCLCKQTVSHIYEIKYRLCSHCVVNFHQRPEKMSIDEWLSQFQPKKINEEA